MKAASKGSFGARTFLAGLGIAGALLASCTGPNVSGLLFTCTTDGDCASGNVCAPVSGQNGAKACQALGAVIADGGADGGDSGADTSPLTVGMPTVLQGVSAQLGIEMKRGVDAWFKQVNDKQGGIKGHRPIQLTAVNDDYSPAGATTAITQLLDVQGTLGANNCATVTTAPDCLIDKPDTLGPKRVTAILGQVGTPTMVVTAPVCIRNDVVYFAPFTGAQRFLRDGNTIADTVFNYRAGYYEETAAMVDYLFRKATPPVADFKKLVAFTQNDTFGAAGYTGLYVAYSSKIGALGATDIHQSSYTRDDLTSVAGSVTDATAYLQPMVDATKAGDNTRFSVGIVMVDAYAPGAKFVHDLKDWVNASPDRTRLLNLVFMNVSFVGADALLSALQSQGTYTETGSGTTKFYGDGVWVTQVVPYYGSSLPGVITYRNDITALDQGAPSWGSLEGYIAAKLFVEGLNRAPTYDSAALIKAYEGITNFDVGIGTTLSFTSSLPAGHQASHEVWLSQMHFDAATPTGTFTVPWIWLGPVAATNQITVP